MGTGWWVLIGFVVFFLVAAAVTPAKRRRSASELNRLYRRVEAGRKRAQEFSDWLSDKVVEDQDSALVVLRKFDTWLADQEGLKSAWAHDEVTPYSCPYVPFELLFDSCIQLGQDQSNYAKRLKALGHGNCPSVQTALRGSRK